MNLNDCCMTYFIAPVSVLELRSRDALLQALRLFHKTPNVVHDPSSATGRKKYYLNAKRNEIFQQLVNYGIVSEDGELLPVNTHESICLPADFDYEHRLSYAGLKTLIACYWMIRYAPRHKSFSFQCTRQELADAAYLSLRHLRDGLKEVQAEALIAVRQLKQNKLRRGSGVFKGIHVSLLDPEQRSGTYLYDIADTNIRSIESIPVIDRYRGMFSQLPGWADLKTLSGDVTNLAVTCPFCSSNKKSFRIDTVEDKWFCHDCGSGGNSLRLWGRLWRKLDKEVVKTGFAAMSRCAPKVMAQEQQVIEAMNEMGE